MNQLALVWCVAFLATVIEGAQLSSPGFLGSQQRQGGGVPTNALKPGFRPPIGFLAASPPGNPQNASKNSSNALPRTSLKAATIPGNATGTYASVAGSHDARSGTESFLGRLAHECSCHFQDICDCHQAMTFMNCVSEACSTGRCDCEDHEFLHACDRIGAFCNSLDISCSSGRAVCLYEGSSENPNKKVEVKSGYMRDEPIPRPIDGPVVGGTTEPPLESRRSLDDIYDELQELKTQKCSLDMATDEGWFDTSSKLPKVKQRIRECIEELEAKQALIPEMHCEKHFEEWSPPPKRAGPHYERPAKNEALRREPWKATVGAALLLFAATCGTFPARI
mmetsp:Transcript_11979/g.18082  ORF Transcript_11979/g.18082 Transcript_11979/m.18082 type:complete len:337 (+) Transcript_11979:120-1130(+)